MSAPALEARWHPDAVVASVTVSACAIGSTLLLMGAMAGDRVMALVGAAVTAATVGVLLCAGWVPGLSLVVVALALPAPGGTGALRIAPAAVVAAMATFAWVLQRCLDRESIDPGPAARTAAIPLLCAVSLSAVAAQAPGAALREVLDWGLLIALFLVAISEFRRRPNAVEELAAVMAATMGVGGALAALQWAGLIPGGILWASYANRATLGFDWPNELGMFLAIGLPFSIYAASVARSGGYRILAALGLGANVLGLVVSFSRGSWVAAVLAPLVLLLIGERRFVLRVWLGAAVAIVLIDAALGGLLIGRAVSLTTDWVVGQRFALLLAGVAMFREHPWLGVGPGGFGPALDEFGARIFELWDYVGSAHNVYVHMAAETGIVGLLALLLFGVMSFVRLLRSARLSGLPPREAALRRAALWSFGTACLVGLFEWPFAHGVGELIMLVAAMGFAASGPSPTAPARW